MTLYFGSRCLKANERSWSMTKLEALSLVYALKSADHIIYGCDNVIVYIDHQPLLAFLDPESELILMIGHQSCVNITFRCVISRVKTTL